MRVKDLKKAAARGLLSRQEMAKIGFKERRTCVTCDRQFRDKVGSTRLFPCGCCAFAYGDPKLRDRSIRQGDRVVLLKTGKAGRVDRFAKRGEEIVGVLTMDNGTVVYVRPDEVEKVLGLEVKHSSGCVHGKALPDGTFKKKRKGGENFEEDDEDSGNGLTLDGSDDGDTVQADEEIS